MSVEYVLKSTKLFVSFFVSFFVLLFVSLFVLFFDSFFVCILYRIFVGGWALVLRCAQFLYSATRILTLSRTIFCEVVAFFQNCAQFLTVGISKYFIARNGLAPFIGRIIPNFYLWKNLVEIQKIKKIPIIFFADRIKFLL